MKKSFTLVELMIAVSILSIGMVFVLRSYLTISAGLDTCSNRIAALQLLRTKMEGHEEMSLVEKGLPSATTEGQFKINNREALYRCEIAPVGIEELKGELNEATLSLVWKEGNRDQDEIIATYFEPKPVEK